MSTKSCFFLALSFALGAVFNTAIAATLHPENDDAEDFVPNGKGWGEPGVRAKKLAQKSTAQTGSGINYHGGPLILGTTNVYYIWYGDWTGNTAVSILNNLGGMLGGSPYYNINTTYYDGSKRHISNSVLLAGTTTDNYSKGTALNDAAVKTVVESAVTSGRLPKDTNGVYVVLTSQDVNETSGFCTQYCGWHMHGTIDNTNLRYAFVGNPARCPSSCAAQTSISPNDNVGADAMASIVVHEVEETVTDPDLNAWYDRRGMENADKCAWKFGTTYKTGNGALANVRLGSQDFLIQQNWVNAGAGYCAMSF